MLNIRKFQQYLTNSKTLISQNKEFKFWHFQNFIEETLQPKTFDVNFNGVPGINRIIIRLV